MTVHHPVRLTLIIASAAVVLGLASTVGVAAVLDGTRNPLAPRLSACSTPSLAGFVVDVTLADMGGMMGPGMMNWRIMGRNICDPRAAGLAEWRLETIERTIQPTDAQRLALTELKAASAKAARIIRPELDRRAYAV